jgi:hypothetical protein
MGQDPYRIRVETWIGRRGGHTCTIVMQKKCASVEI